MKSKIPWFAVALILVGTTMLLQRMGVISLSWQSVFWLIVLLLGVFKIVTGFICRPAGGRARFWGTEFLLFGLYFFLHESDIIDVPPGLALPMILLAIGAGLVVTFSGNLKDWHILVPGLFFVATGGAMVLAEFGFIVAWEVEEAVRQYWPAGLILFGASLLLNSWRGNADLQRNNK